uniref:Ankyrin repeat domain 6a n=1 Tax=Sinocyclocheilus rhinocerous TaxID=307959 RepID=A0A673MRK0_9TELE
LPYTLLSCVDRVLMWLMYDLWWPLRFDRIYGHTTVLNVKSNWMCFCFFQGHQTALHRAAVVGNRDAISALIHGGCALDLQDKEGNTALHEVSWHGFSSCVKLLVKAGANVQVKNKAGNTPLHLAYQNGHSQTARVLLQGGAMPDSKNNAGDTCLHIAARYNHLAMIKILLGSFCSVTEKNQIGDTALHVAAALNHKKTVNLLLEAGADANIRNNTGHTALDKARDNNNRDLAILLAKSNQVSNVITFKDFQFRTSSLSLILNMFLLLKKLDHVFRREYQLHERGSPSQRVKHSSTSSQEEEETPGKAYQLYTLYRDKDGQIKQAPANDCHCKPLIKTLENKLKAAKMEMRSEIHTVQEEMNCRLGRIEQKNKHQIKVLEKLMQERVSAETMECHYRINQRATLERLVAATNAVKSWCMSKIQDFEVRMPAETQYYKLLRSPSVDHSLSRSDKRDELCDSTASSSLSTSSKRYNDSDTEPAPSPAWKHSRHLKDRIKAHHAQTQQNNTMKTLEVFSQRPVEATFTQERANLHAMEVTQRFFETVSTQLERWYERKIQEAQKVAEQKAMQDRASLLEKINTLEEELQKLRTNTNTNS